MNRIKKKTILIDLDGVLNSYNGSFNEEIIPPIQEGAKEFLKEISRNYKIKIFTNRNLLKTKKWIYQNEIDHYIYDITNRKELCYILIDDRCIKFNGNYSDLKNEINNFKVWYK